MTQYVLLAHPESDSAWWEPVETVGIALEADLLVVEIRPEDEVYNHYRQIAGDLPRDADG